MVEVPQTTWNLWLNIALTSACASYAAVAFLVAAKTMSRPAFWWGMTALLTAIITGCIALLQAPDSRIPDQMLLTIQRWARFGIVVILALAVNDVLSSANGRAQDLRRIFQWWKWGREHGS